MDIIKNKFYFQFFLINVVFKKQLLQEETKQKKTPQQKKNKFFLRCIIELDLSFVISFLI